MDGCPAIPHKSPRAVSRHLGLARHKAWLYCQGTDALTLDRIHGSHPPLTQTASASFQLVLDYLFNRSKSLQALPAFRRRFIDRRFARNCIQ